MIKPIMSVLKRYAWFKRLSSKLIYESLAKRIQESKWHYMNYGYVPGPDEQPIVHEGDAKLQRTALQMYHYLAAKVGLENKQVLEVGSGRGGGAKYLAGAMKPASYVGMDLAQSAVDLSNKMHQLPNLKFIQGSAESIPVADASFDVVVNVESCHAYGSVPQFLKEVKRVLRPGGYFVMVDFRDTDKMRILEQQLKESGLQLISTENISKNVVESIEAEDESKKKLISEIVPGRWQKQFSEFAGVVGSRFHRMLKEGSKEYFRFVMQKP